MKKNTFSIIIVPHDIKKTRTFRVPYRLFYTFVALVGAGLVVMIVFVATYGKLLIKARESVMLERQISELTKRNEQIGELMRNLSQLRTLNARVRGMLGLEMTPEDSLAVRHAAAEESVAPDGSGDAQAHILRSIPSFWPVRGYITKGFSVAGGEKDVNYHPGIDIAIVRGTPVRAAAEGYISETGWDDVFGRYVWIDHGYGIKTLYGHNDRLVVIRGERVGRGQTIAYAGSTGKSTAPHLHFEVLQNNIPVDPLKYLPK